MILPEPKKEPWLTGALHLQNCLFTIYLCCTQAVLNLNVIKSFSMKAHYGAHLTALEGQIQEFGTGTNITGNFHHTWPWLLQARVPSSLQVVSWLVIWFFLIQIIVLYYNVIAPGLNESYHFVMYGMEADIF